MNTAKIQPFNLEAKTPFSLHKHVSIQASAGTGKTYSLTTVVARLVAEQGLRADQLLLMTFTNEATAELKQSTRSRCIEALHTLRGVGISPEWLKHVQASDDTKSNAIKHLEQFLSRYDEVTISTIHGFCQTVMRQAGLSGLVPTEFEVVASIDDIIDQTITDTLSEKLAVDPLYLWGSAVQDPTGSTNVKYVSNTLKYVRKSVTTVLNNEGAITLPAEVDSPLHIEVKGSESPSANLYAQRIADTVRLIVQEVKDRCKAAGLITYNDMISVVASALTSRTDDSTTLAKHLARQYPVIMVDEFQDTDSMQWAIFERIFEVSNGDTSLITVGDPKQAIYRFRGADVNVYLSAVEHSSEQYNLSVNYRSDKPLLDALHALMRNEYFDNNQKVPFVEVSPAPDRTDSGLQVGTRGNNPPDPVHMAPLEIRYIPQDDNNKLNVEQKYDIIATDLVHRVVTMLTEDEIVEKSGDDESRRPVTTSDIAVLVRNHHHAAAVYKKLTAAGVPAVRLKSGTVFDTEAARHMIMLMRALAHPSRPQFVRTYALSWFGGKTEEQIQGTDIDMLIDLQRECADSADHLHRNGFTALYLSYRNQSAFLSRLLSLDDGLRHLTDLDHIADILASRPQFASSVGPLECLEVLTDLIDGAEEESDEQVRRIETDQKAVRIMTIHASKGLQFPIVFLPTLFHPSRQDQSHPAMFPASLSTSGHDVRVIDVSSEFGIGTDSKKSFPRNWTYEPADPDGVMETSLHTWNDRKNAMLDDIDADHRRLFYVAMTRAKHKIVGYWYPGKKEPIDPFSNALARSVGMNKPPIGATDLKNAFLKLTAESGGNVIGHELSTELQPLPRFNESPTITNNGDANAAEDTSMRAASFERPGGDVAVHGFGRWSYSSITRRMKAGSLDTSRVVATDAMSGVGDESDVDNDITVSDVAFVWNGLPAGASFGDAVHRVFDHIDPSSPDLSSHVHQVVTETFASWGSDLDRESLAEALVANITTPLDRDFQGRSLADLGTKHRLSEMKFEFPLPSREGVQLLHVVDVILRDSGISDRARSYFESLRTSPTLLATVAGFMNGSIDAVFRITGEHDHFIVCDYKSNKLHNDADLNPISRYDTVAMESKMLEDGYFFQALIYSVALHRYLKMRIPHYEFETHFGGVAYLFLRGLDGSLDSNGLMHGYFRWMPQKSTVLQLDDLFAEELV
jgi:exodeoxyribonuclease V beta subunit